MIHNRAKTPDLPIAEFTLPIVEIPEPDASLLSSHIKRWFDFSIEIPVN